jgi:hypothetical protein
MSIATFPAFKSVVVGATTIVANDSGSALTFVEGTNITLALDPATDTITISSPILGEGSISLTNDNSSNSTNYIVFTSTLTGSLLPRTDTDLYYNPSTGILAVTGIRFGDATIQTTAGGLYTLPTATTSVLGGVKVDGTTITIDGNGVISSTGGGSPYTLPTATTSVLGGVKVDGTTVTIDGNGVISSASAYSLPTATTSVLGGVKVDGTTVTINGNGVISSTGGSQPPDIQNIYNEIINNYLVYSDIAGAPTPVDDINQLADTSNRLTPVAITGITYPNNSTSVSTIGGETVTLTGTGFQRLCNVYVNGTPSISTSFVNSTSVQFVTTAQNAGTYLVTLVNPDATSAILSPGILYLEPGTPRFTRPSGLLASYNRNVSISTTLTVTGGTPPYTISIISGSLPSGLTLNSSTGVISGTTPNVSFDTIFNFVAQVTDSADPAKSNTSAYYILVALPVPVELTIGGPGVSGASTIISNRAFFIEYEEDITNTPAFTISGTSVISNNIFFVEYEEDITNSPTLTITGTAIKSYTPV